MDKLGLLPYDKGSKLRFIKNNSLPASTEFRLVIFHLISRHTTNKSRLAMRCKKIFNLISKKCDLLIYMKAIFAYSRSTYLVRCEEMCNIPCSLLFFNFKFCLIMWKHLVMRSLVCSLLKASTNKRMIKQGRGKK